MEILSLKDKIQLYIEDSHDELIRIEILYLDKMARVFVNQIDFGLYSKTYAIKIARYFRNKYSIHYSLNESTLDIMLGRKVSGSSRAKN